MVILLSGDSFLHSSIKSAKLLGLIEHDTRGNFLVINLLDVIGDESLLVSRIKGSSGEGLGFEVDFLGVLRGVLRFELCPLGVLGLSRDASCLSVLVWVSSKVTRGLSISSSKLLLNRSG